MFALLSFPLAFRRFNLSVGFVIGPLLVLMSGACAHNPNKAEKIDTKIDSSALVTGDTSVGVKDGNMIVQRKVAMNEELRRLQNEVYELEDHVYGNRKYGSLGLYGVLERVPHGARG